MKTYNIHTRNEENGIVAKHSIEGDTYELALSKFKSDYPHWTVLGQNEDDAVDSPRKSSKANTTNPDYTHSSSRLPKETLHESIPVISNKKTTSRIKVVLTVLVTLFVLYTGGFELLDRKGTPPSKDIKLSDYGSTMMVIDSEVSRQRSIANPLRFVLGNKISIRTKVYVLQSKDGSTLVLTKSEYDFLKAIE